MKGFEKAMAKVAELRDQYLEARGGRDLLRETLKDAELATAAAYEKWRAAVDEIVVEADAAAPGGGRC